MSGLGMILSLEDDDRDFLTLKGALRAAGVKNPVERCHDAGAAMQSLVEGDFAYRGLKASLVLLDLNLPGFDGLQFLRAFRARDPERKIPVLVLATSSHPRDVDACYGAGADAYLIKPFEIEDWENQIGRVAEFWLTAREQDGEENAERASDDPCQPDIERPSASTENAVSANDRAKLKRAIEGEIIPRLLLAHGVSNALMQGSAAAHGDTPSRNDDVSEFVHLIMAGDMSVAASYVASVGKDGANLDTIYHGLVAPAARLIGELWKADLCSFEEFTEALSRLQSLLAQIKRQHELKTMH